MSIITIRAITAPSDSIWSATAMAEIEVDAARRPSAVPWPPILLALVVMGAWGLGEIAPISWPGTNDTPAHIIGLSFGLAGLALAIWAGITLSHAKTTILPNQGASHLVTGGPYAWRRNPIYLGDMMMLMGVAELTQNIWFVGASVAFGLLVTWLAIIPEERHLEAKFGDAWRDYAARSRRLL